MKTHCTQGKGTEIQKHKNPPTPREVSQFWRCWYFEAEKSLLVVVGGPLFSALQATEQAISGLSSPHASSTAPFWQSVSWYHQLSPFRGVVVNKIALVEWLP